MDRSAIVSSSAVGTTGDILSRPVMAFLFQQHNLDSLQYTMKQALRKATCRVFAMQVIILKNFLKTKLHLILSVSYLKIVSCLYRR